VGRARADGQGLVAAEEAAGVLGGDSLGLDWLLQLLDPTVHMNYICCLGQLFVAISSLSSFSSDSTSGFTTCFFR
jgi:hypothetical protein